MKFVVSAVITALMCSGEECSAEEDTSAMMQARDRTLVNGRKGEADFESLLTELSEGDADIYEEDAAGLVGRAAMLLRATQPISVQFDTLPDSTKTKLVRAARRLQSSVQAAPELAEIFEGHEQDLIQAAAALEEQASETPGLHSLLETASMLQQGQSVDKAVSGKGKVNMDGASLNKQGCNGCKCIDPQGTGANSVPLNNTEYLRASWFVQKQQVNGYQPREKLFCVMATYNETFRGKKLKLSGGAPKGGYFHAFNNGNYKATNGVSLENHASPKFTPSFATPLCARQYQKDVPAAVKVAPCGLPKSFSGDYWVVEAGPTQDNYDWAIISAGQPSVKLSDGLCTTPTYCSGPAQAACGLWLVTRQQVPSAATFTALEAAAVRQGISLKKVVTIDHTDCGYDGYFVKPNERKNIVEVAQSVPEASTLVSAITAADLVEVLQGPGPSGVGFTVFAPSNAAFTALGEVANDLLKAENKADLASLLSFHVVSGYRTSKFLSLNNGAKLKTLEGRSITVNVVDGAVKLGASSVVTADVLASNGIIHLVDSVLDVPKNLVEVAQSVPDLSTLVSAVVAADLVETFSDPTGTYTLFAPTNEAFATLEAGVLDNLLLPENIKDLVKLLQAHALDSEVVSTQLEVNNRRRNKYLTLARRRAKYVTVIKAEDGSVTVNEATVVTADVAAANGVAHVINAVL